MGNKGLQLGIDMGGTKILAAVVDAKGKILSRAKKRTKADKGEEAIMKKLVAASRDAVEAAGLKYEDLDCVGVGAPGPISSATGVIFEAPNLNVKDFHLRDLLSEALGVPVYACNDVNAGTWGEYLMGAGRGATSVVGAFIGTGIGGGIIIDDDIYEGSGLAAGEIGHICMQVEGGLECGCGKRGCLETLASRTGITRQICAAIDSGEKCSLTETVREGKKLRSGMLFDAYQSGDKVVCRVIDTAAEHLGIGLGSIANVLNPERIVLGGGVVEAFGKPYIEKVEKAMKGFAFDIVAQTTQLVEGTLGDDAGILGAALQARRRHERGE